MPRKSKTQLPTLDGLTFADVVDWSRKDLGALLANEKGTAVIDVNHLSNTSGKQLFRCFLEENFAEENLIFYDSVNELKVSTRNCAVFVREMTSTEEQERCGAL